MRPWLDRLRRHVGVRWASQPRNTLDLREQTVHSSRIPLPLLLLHLTGHRDLGVLLGEVQLDLLLAPLAETSPRPHQRELPEKIPLHGEAVIPCHVPGGVTAFQRDHAHNLAAIPRSSSPTASA